jgi:hypothetical protein
MEERSKGQATIGASRPPHRCRKAVDAGSPLLIRSLQTHFASQTTHQDAIPLISLLYSIGARARCSMCLNVTRPCIPRKRGEGHQTWRGRADSLKSGASLDTNMLSRLLVQVATRPTDGHTASDSCCHARPLFLELYQSPAAGEGRGDPNRLALTWPLRGQRVDRVWTECLCHPGEEASQPR